MRRYTGFILILLRSFYRRLVWVLLLALGIAGTLFFYWHVSATEPYFALHMTAYFQAVLSLTFTLMGLEMGREQQQVKIADFIFVYSRKTTFYSWAQVLTIGLLDLAMTILIAGGCLIRLLLSAAPALWIGQTMAYLLLLYFLPCWILGVLGLLLGSKSQSEGIYLLMIFVWLITSSLNTGLLRYASLMA